MKIKRLLLLLVAAGVYLGSFYAYATEIGVDSSVTPKEKTLASDARGRKEEPKKADFALSEPIPGLTQIGLDEIDELEGELEEEETEDGLEDKDKTEETDQAE